MNKKREIKGRNYHRRKNTHIEDNSLFDVRLHWNTICQQVLQNPLIIKNVFAHLNAKELYPLRRVNQLWNTVIFKFIIEELETRRLVLGSEAEVQEWNSLFKNSDKIIHRNFKFFSDKGFSLQSNVEFFTISGPAMKCLDLSQFTVVEESGEIEQTLEVPINFLREILIKFCPNLSSLKIGSSYEKRKLSGLFHEDDPKLFKMEKLSLGHVFTVETELLKATPNLKSLTFEVNSQPHGTYNVDSSIDCFLALKESSLLSKLSNLEFKVFDQIISDQIQCNLNGQKMNLKVLRIKALCKGKSAIEPYNYFWDFLARSGLSVSLESLKIVISGFEKVHASGCLWSEVPIQADQGEIGFQIPFTSRQFNKLKKLAINDRYGSTIMKNGFFTKKSLENILFILPNLEKVQLSDTPELNLNRYSISSYPEVYSVKTLHISDVLYHSKFLLSLDTVFPNLEMLQLHFCDEDEDCVRHVKRQRKALKSLWSLWPKLRSLTIQFDTAIVDFDSIISGIDEERFPAVKVQMIKGEKIIYDGSSIRYMQNLEKLDLIFPNIEYNSICMKESTYLTDFSAQFAFEILPKFRELKVCVESKAKNFNFSKITNKYCKAVRMHEEYRNVEFSKSDLRKFVVKTHFFNI